MVRFCSAGMDVFRERAAAGPPLEVPSCVKFAYTCAVIANVLRKENYDCTGITTVRFASKNWDLSIN